MRILFIGCIESLDAQLDFHINYYVNTDNELDKKIEIISKYVGEIGETPFPRSSDAIRGMAQYRGVSCYYRYAETFRGIKEIW